jgi:hypothetical protein
VDLVQKLKLSGIDLRHIKALKKIIKSCEMNDEGYAQKKEFMEKAIGENLPIPNPLFEILTKAIQGPRGETVSFIKLQQFLEFFHTTPISPRND